MLRKFLLLILAHIFFADNLFANNIPSQVQDFEKIFNVIKKNKYQICPIEKNEIMLKNGYFPFMLVHREPIIIYVNKKKYDLPINNFKQFLDESKKIKFSYGIVNEKDYGYFSTLYLKSIFNLEIIVNYKKEKDLDKFLDEIDVILADASFSQYKKLKPIAALSNKRTLKLKYKLPLNQSFEFVAPTVGETDKKGLEFTIPYIMYVKKNITLKDYEELNKWKRDIILSANGKEFIFSNKLDSFIRNYEKRNISLEY